MIKEEISMQPRKRKVGLITFGLSLILIGAFYLLEQYTNITLSNDLYLLWPIFLILLGLEFIITKFIYDRKEEEVLLSPSILSIVLIILILGVTAFWRHFPEIKDFPRMLSRNVDYYRYKTSESFDSGTIILDEVETISVNNTMGDITVKASPDNTLSVKAQITVRSDDEERAREYAKNAIKITKGVHTSIETERIYDTSNIVGSVSVDYTILVPREVDLRIENNFGAIQVSGIKGDVTSINRNGATTITNIDGDVEAESSFGPITIERVTGKVDADNKNGKIRAWEIGDTTKLTNSFGEIEARHINGDLTADTKNGTVEVEDIKGDADLTSSFGRISAATVAGNVSATNRNGNIELSDITGNIDCDTSFGSIVWKTDFVDNTHIEASSRLGEIVADDFSIPVKKETTTSKISHTLGSGDRKVVLKTSNGSITIEK